MTRLLPWAKGNESSNEHRGIRLQGLDVFRCDVAEPCGQVSFIEGKRGADAVHLQDKRIRLHEHAQFSVVSVARLAQLAAGPHEREASLRRAEPSSPEPKA